MEAATEQAVSSFAKSLFHKRGEYGYAFFED
jgi:hypothetical protein